MDEGKNAMKWNRAYKIKGAYAVLTAVVLLVSILLNGCAQKNALAELSGTSTSAAGMQTDETSQENKASETESKVLLEGPKTSEKEKSASSEETGNWYVHVCGAVNQPGVYELSQGSRCFEAVQKAGGFTADAAQDYVNMAEVLGDGVRLEIPTRVQAAEAQNDKIPVTASGFGKTDAGKSEQTQTAGKTGEEALININTADVSSLCTLSGVGESRARSIITYREEHGSFQNCDELMQVTGIKEGLYSKIKDHICVR